jgi:hypothetical protein
MPDGLAFYCKACRKSQRRPGLDRLTMIRWQRRRPVQAMLSRARSSAKKRGLDFAITPADVTIPKRCPVLGIPLVNTVGEGRRVDGSITLDRIDNTRGYVPGNVLVVSWRANRIKSDASLEELRLIADFYSQWRA